MKTGDAWNELRLCLTCGYVGCCDDSKNRHATRHFEQTRHPLIRSFQRGQHWGWCYVDKQYFERMPGTPRPGLWSGLSRWFRR
jgi:uncharacterized UBP type Zn finger protein